MSRHGVLTIVATGLLTVGVATGTPPSEGAGRWLGSEPAPVGAGEHTSRTSSEPQAVYVPLAEGHDSPRLTNEFPAWAQDAIARVRKAVLDRLTMPLGTVPFED